MALPHASSWPESRLRRVLAAAAIHLFMFVVWPVLVLVVVVVSAGWPLVLWAQSCQPKRRRRRSREPFSGCF